MKKCVFLDRDGVLNQTIFRMGKERAPYTLDEFAIKSGVKEGLLLLKENDFLLVVVTNQPDVARGWVSRETVDTINNKIRELLPIDDIKVCFHTEKDSCDCRKPRPGMLIEAAKEHGIDFSRSWMIGDRHTDIEAGKRAGCRTILIGDVEHQGTVEPDYHFSNFFDAARLITEINLTL